MICLDSTFLIDFLRNDELAVKKAVSLEAEGCELATTAVNVFEVSLGIELMKNNREAQLKKFESFISDIDILPLDYSSSKEGSAIMANLARKGNIIDDLDCLIAGILKANNCDALVTRNVRHFNRIDGIKVERY